MDGSLCVKKKYSCTVKDHTKLLNRKKTPKQTKVVNTSKRHNLSNIITACRKECKTRQRTTSWYNVIYCQCNKYFDQNPRYVVAV